MCAAFAECLLTVVPLMANTLVMTVPWCGEFAAMRFICSVLQNGCQPKPSSDALSADDHGNSSLQLQTQQQLASHAQHSVRMSAPAFAVAVRTTTVFFANVFWASSYKFYTVALMSCCIDLT